MITLENLVLPVLKCKLWAAAGNAGNKVGLKKCKQLRLIKVSYREKQHKKLWVI